MNTRLLVLLTATSLLAGPALVSAQLPPPQPKPVLGARMPALSPDGRQIAFVHRGDLWTAPVKGGRALLVTQHVDTDAYPLFSPDGKWIAFASRRTGNWDVFAVPAEGGESRQITWHSGTDLTFGWSPDGKQLVLGTKRDSPNYGLFTIDVNTLRTELLAEDYATLNYPSFSPDGRKIVYGRYGFHWTRPRYQGAAAAQIWVLDRDTGYRHPITRNDRQHLWPQFLPGGRKIVAVTYGEVTPSVSRLGETIPKLEDTPERTPNLWEFDLEGEGKPLTKFVGGSVRWPSVATKSGDIAFEYGADLWLLKDGSRKPAKLEFFVPGDEKESRRKYEKLTTGVEECEPSPDGKMFAFGLKGDIWTVAIDRPKGVAGRSAEIAKRLTDWAGDDSDFVWAPDGKKIYFTSDRGFSTGLYLVDVETAEVSPVFRREEDVTSPRLSPEGKQIALWVAGTEGGLFVVNLDNQESRRLVHVPGPHWRGMGGGSIEWSPDGKWLAYTRSGENRAWNIWVVRAEGGEAHNLTRLNAHHGMPAWSPDGKHLFFQSNREGDGLYVVALQEEEVRTDDTDIKFKKPTEPLDIQIDFAGITRRIRKVSSTSPSSDLAVTSEGQIIFRARNELITLSYDGKNLKKLVTSGTNINFRVSKDGKKAFFGQNGELFTVGIGGGNPDKVSFIADWERDIRAERLAAFTQFWRSYRRGFYDPNFHGRDWEAIRKRYEPLVEAVETGDEFATLLGMMVGELEASHSEVTPAKDGERGPTSPHLGFTIDYAHGGPGLKVKDVPKGAPGSFEKTLLKPGEFILQINDLEVTATEKLYEWINNKQDREFEFLVNSHPIPEGARKVSYKVLTQKQWDDLIYDNRVERLREYVEKGSGDKIGYLHIPAMSGSDQARFEREAYEYILGKEAMIIDVRFNRGGNISDTLIDWLERKPHGYYRPRDGAPEPSPHRAWDKPIIVLMNEHSYSNAEMFPYAMRERGLARLVGMPTPGYVIWTSTLSLVDGTGARMPQSGVFRLDGTPQENIGEQPDVRVPLSPEDWVAGRDPQLDKAIELLMPKEPLPISEKQDKPAEEKTPVGS
jgi:tricorn protease